MVKVHISRWPGIQWLYHVFQAWLLKVFRMPRDKIRPDSCCHLNRMPRDETAIELSSLITRKPRDETVIVGCCRIARMPRDETLKKCHEMPQKPPGVFSGCVWTLFRKIKVPGTITALIHGKTRFRWRASMVLKPAFQSGNGRITSFLST